MPLIYQKKRAFRIPFHIGAQAQARIKEVQLWVSEDAGFHWEPKSRTTPDLGKFTFRTSHDGEFWFATRTVTVDDEFSPPMSQTVEPSMKVVVDSVPPSLVLEPDGRRGSTAAIRWEAKDEHLDLKTLVLEYQAEGAHEWRKVPIRRRNLMGAESWDAGTADSLRVRATVADKAGNVADAEIVLPEGTAETPDLAAVAPEATAPPPVEQISSGNGLSGGNGSLIAQNSTFPPIQESPPSAPGSGSRPGARRTLTRRPKSDDALSAGPFQDAPGWDRTSAGRAGDGVRKNSPGTLSPSGPPAFSDPFPMGATSTSAPASSPDGSRSPGNRTMLVPGPRFKLQYAVEEAGPDGPATVELWITQDGGRTWIRRGEDPDRVSPIEVDVGGEGTFGISLVARSASGLGDQPPGPGDPPQTWVEVDATPPSVQL